MATLTEDSLIEMMVGRKLEDQYPHLDKLPGEIRLKVDNLCGPGVNDVSFTLRQGEILGVAGLMGAGRTELMKVLYGALPEFKAACERANVPYTVTARPGMTHCYCMLPYFKEAKEDFAMIVEQFKK